METSIEVSKFRVIIKKIFISKLRSA
jgi:hypothetical protein